MSRDHASADPAACIDLARQVFAALHRSTSADWLALDLTMGQMKALMAITARGPQPVGELGRRLGISEPAASLLADKLEAAGLASRERDPADRRRSLVTPTAAAVELATTLRAGRDEHVRRWLTALTPDETAALCCGLRGLLRAIERDGATDARDAADAAEPAGGSLATPAPAERSDRG